MGTQSNPEVEVYKHHLYTIHKKDQDHCMMSRIPLIGLRPQMHI